MLITATMLLAVQSANFTAASPSLLQPLEPCLGNYSCDFSSNSSNLGFFSGLKDAAECRRECDLYAQCEHFTFFTGGQMAGTCFLFSGCSRRYTMCRGTCTSGPRCSNCATCNQLTTNSSRILSILRTT